MVVKPFSPTNKVTIFGHAKNFMFALGRVTFPGRPIIFLAHSLGGIHVKEVLPRFIYCKEQRLTPNSDAREL